MKYNRTDFDSAIVELQKMAGLFQHVNRTGFVYVNEGWIMQIELHNDTKFVNYQPFDKFDNYKELVTPHYKDFGDEQCYSFYNNYTEPYNEHYAALAMNIVLLLNE